MLDELIYDTLPPEAISDELRPTIEALGLERNCRELAEEGWTVVEDVAPAELIERLHDAVLAASTVQGGQGGGSVCLTKDSVFAEAATNPKVCAMAEFSVGRGFLLSQISCSVHGEGPGFVGLHADNNWLPAPFPAHNQILTACWPTNGFSPEGGSTVFVPGSQNLRRHPNQAEVETAETIAITCPPGAVAMWDGNVWHAQGAREIPGQRVVAHVAYCRFSQRQVEDYAAHADELIARHGPVMSQLLGREDALFTVEGGFADPAKLRAMINNAKR